MKTSANSIPTRSFLSARRMGVLGLAVTCAAAIASASTAASKIAGVPLRA